MIKLFISLGSINRALAIMFLDFAEFHFHIEVILNLARFV
jgi:hypothetical protein